MRFQVVTIISLLATSAVALLPEVMAVKSREIDQCQFRYLLPPR